MTKIGQPPSDGMGRPLPAPRMAEVPAARGQLFEPLTQSGFRIRMDARAGLSTPRVEGMAGVLLSVHAAYVGLLAARLQKKLLFDEPADALAHPPRGTGAFAEDGAAVGISDKRKDSPFEFSARLIEHDATRYGT